MQEQPDPRGDTPEIAQQELSDAIMDTSPAVKTTIYYQATDVRSKTGAKKIKPVMERTLPIFRALANSDARNEFHANHGQLGFALKDKRTPDWAEAEKELTRQLRFAAIGALMAGYFTNSIGRYAESAWRKTHKIPKRECHRTAKRFLRILSQPVATMICCIRLGDRWCLAGCIGTKSEWRVWANRYNF